MHKPDRRTLRVSLGVVTIAGATIAALAASHPAQAASVLASVTSSVSCATTTACVSGTNTGKGPGVEGTSKSSYGVEGVSTSNDGLKGISTSSNGLSASSTSSFGVKGESSTSYGIYGSTATGTAAIYGTNTKGPKNGLGFGLLGTSAVGEGVAGIYNGTSSGVAGVAGVSTTNGLTGTVNGTGIGVGGQTYSGIGVEGISMSGAGAKGDSESGDGVQGVSSSSNGIEGDSTTNYGVFAYSGSGYSALGATSSSGGGAVITGGTFGLAVAGATNKYQLVTGPTQAESFMVDAPGNIYYAGSLIAFSNSSSGAKVRSFGPKSATPTVEDTGSAQLVAGLATVRLDPTFASSIDPHVAYRVFLTPDGDTRGLYVATKTPAGFIVRETQGGRSTLAFDYRIVATTLGAAGQRMSVATDSLLPHADSLMLAKIRARSRSATDRTLRTEATFQRTPFGVR